MIRKLIILCARTLACSLTLCLSNVLCAQDQTVHPRLYITTVRVASLKEEIRTTRTTQWNTLRNLADSLVKKHPPVYEEAIKDKDPEQLWERTVGNALPTLAMAWLLSGDEVYKRAAKEWALAACQYPTWGGSGKTDGTDLPAGHLLFGLAMVYDWMQPDLDADTLKAIRETMLRRGDKLCAAADEPSGRYWKEQYLQNHLWVNMAGLAAAALAMPGEPACKHWLEVARDKFQRTEQALGDDGASQEGVGYWSYGTEYLLKYWTLSADLLHEDLASPWWKKTAMYRLYLGLPQNACAKNNSIVDFADCTRADYYGPDFQLYNLAHRFHDGHAQWLAQTLEKCRVTCDTTPFLTLLWYDPTIEVKSPDDLPALHHFADIGIVSARSDWSGDESLLVFKCGPPAGHEAVSKGFKKDPGIGHVHPDANHFVLFGDGEWLLRDDGYSWKETGQHNTLLVDGEGQRGEHTKWFNLPMPLPLQGEPNITECRSTPDFDVITGEASGAYPPTLGLKQFTRHLLFIKPSALLVIDDIQLDRPHDLELRFHPEYPAIAQGNGSFCATGKKAQLRIENLTPENVSSKSGDFPALDRDKKAITMLTVAYSTHADHWQNVTALSWSASNGTPSRIQISEKENHWRFSVYGRKYDFDRKTGTFSAMK